MSSGCFVIGMMFDASMTVTSVTWDENYRNSTSDAYRDLVSNFTSQVRNNGGLYTESFNYISHHQKHVKCREFKTLHEFLTCIHVYLQSFAPNVQSIDWFFFV